MIAAPFAFSLTSSFTQVGAIAGLAALIGIAILALLVFSQAREIKRLREWAGRAPERSAELEQRLSSTSAVRAQPLGGARPVPRATPVNVRATSASGQASRVAPAASTLAAQTPVPVAPAPQGTAPALEQPTDTQDNTAEAEASAETIAPATADATPPAPDPTSQPPDETSAPAQAPPPPPQRADAQAGPAEVREVAPPPNAETVSQSPQPAPLTAAAAARSARPPLPPAPGTQTPAVNGLDKPAPAAGQPSRAPRASAPPIDPPTRGGSRPVEQYGGRRQPAAGPTQRKAYKHLRDEPVRARRPRTIMIFAAVIVAVIALVLVLTSLGGGSNKGAPAERASSLAPTSHSSVRHRAGSAQASPSPASVSVTVVNGTEINRLAHHLAERLQQKGFTRADARDTRPPSAYSQTAIEYANNQRAAADSVAQTLNVSTGQVRPLEPSIASLSAGASIVVVAGSDQSTAPSPAGATKATGGGESEESASSQPGG